MECQLEVQAETIGGSPQGSSGNWFQQRTVHPRMGDRQDRLGLVNRTSGSQYNWLPNSYVVDAFEVDSATHLRQINIGFKINSTRLANLNIDSNEALEAEVNFYNYGSATGIPERGYAYIYSLEYINHNVPSEAFPYQDTRFADDQKFQYIGTSWYIPNYRWEDKEPSFSFGIANTTPLKADTMYWCVMQGKPNTYYDGNGNWGFVPSTGLAKLTFTRSYNFINPVLNLMYPSNGHDCWSVFNEEEEQPITPLTFKNFKVPKRVELTINDDALYIKRTKH